MYVRDKEVNYFWQLKRKKKLLKSRPHFENIV